MRKYNIYLKLSGLPLESRGHFYDFEAGVRYQTVDNLTISLGYRKIDLDIHRNNDSGGVSMNGLFLGIQYNF